MNKKCCLSGAIFFLAFIISGVSANSTDNTIYDYITNFNTIADDYATGKISAEEFVCELAKEGLYFDHQFLGASLTRSEADDLIRDLNEKYENKITLNELDAALSRAYEPSEEKIEGTDDIPPTPPPIEMPLDSPEPGPTLSTPSALPEGAMRGTDDIPPTPPPIERPSESPESSSQPATQTLITAAPSEKTLDGMDDVPPTPQPILREEGSATTTSSQGPQQENQRLNNAYQVLRHQLTVEDRVVTYYSLNIERPILLYLFINDDNNQPFTLYTRPSLEEIYEPHLEEMMDQYGAEEGPMVVHEKLRRMMMECKNDVAEPLAKGEIDSMREEIEKAKAIKADTTKSEEILEEAIELFNNGAYMDVISVARRAKRVTRAEFELKKLERMSKDERRSYILDKIGIEESQDVPKRENVEVKTLEDAEEIQRWRDIGLKKFGYMYALDGESIYGLSAVVDLENKTVTTYENKLLDSYDLYVEMDMAFMYGMGLLMEKEADPFEYGLYIGKGILRGDVKVKPFWKIYKIPSMMKTMGDFGTEFSKGITTSLT